jgi:hypothetical protein
VGVRGTSFFEQPEDRDMETIHLDTWSVAVHLRVGHDDDFAAWVEAGVGGLSTSAGDWASSSSTTCRDLSAFAARSAAPGTSTRSRPTRSLPA